MHVLVWSVNVGMLPGGGGVLIPPCGGGGGVVIPPCSGGGGGGGGVVIPPCRLTLLVAIGERHKVFSSDSLVKNKAIVFIL